MQRHLFVSLLCIIIILSTSSFGQSPDSTAQRGLSTSVTLSSFVLPNKVPLNRTTTLTIEITWEGDIDLVKINEIDEPVLTHLDIVGTSSSNKVSGSSTGKKAVKTISYILQPNTLGMAYIESLALSYEDLTTGKTHHLMTQRYGVEAIGAVAEEGERRLPWIPLIAIGIVLVIITFWIIQKRRAAQDEEDDIEIQPIEEGYLDRLKNEIDLKNPDRRDMFTQLSKLFRKYLSEKFEILAMEATTEGLVASLKETEVDEKLIQRCENLFNKADVVKFSGQDATQAELDEAYTTVETILESQLTAANERLRLAEIEKSKRRGLFKKR